MKLLRILQDHEIRRVGENRQRHVDVRVIAAKNRNLTEEIAERRFRRDLFYRLRVVEIVVLPFGSSRRTCAPWLTGCSSE